MTQVLKCLECKYESPVKSYKQIDCGLIELLMLRDIHMRTFRHKMEIIDE